MGLLEYLRHTYLLFQDQGLSMTVTLGVRLLDAVKEYIV